MSRSTTGAALSALAFALVTASSPLVAQERPAYETGLLVRVSAPALFHEPVTGRLLSRGPEQWVVDVSGGAGARVVVPTAAISLAERTAGKERFRSAVIGGVVGGLALGTAVAVTGYASDPDGYGDMIAVVGFGAGVVFGTPAGAIVGVVVAPERWMPMARPDPGAVGTEGPTRTVSLGLQLDPGLDVRLRPGGGDRVRGELVDFGDTVTVRTRGGLQSFPAADLDRIEIRGGRDRPKGAAIGAAVLGGIATVFGAVDLANDEISADDYVAGLIGNVVIGAGLGYLLAPVGWRGLPLPGRWQ